jgi:hypothetical protein
MSGLPTYGQSQPPPTGLNTSTWGGAWNPDWNDLNATYGRNSTSKNPYWNVMPQPFNFDW